MSYVSNGIRLVATGANQSVQRLKTTTVYTQTISPGVGPVLTNTYLNEVEAHSQVSTKQVSPTQPSGWRNPTYYRRLTCINEGFAYDYIRRDGTRRNWAGSTPLEGGLGPGSNCLRWGTKVAGGIYVPDVDSNTIARANTECLAKLKEGFNLLADFAELPQTVNLIATAATRVAYAYRAVQQGHYNTAVRCLTGTHSIRSVPSGTAEQWLSLQYGWKPLLGDIFTGVELVREAFKQDKPMFKTQRSVTANYGLPPKPVNKAFWIADGKAEIGVQVILYAKVSNATLALADSMSILNPLSLAWEEFPYSFVVDWIAPIGTYLQALTAPLGIEFHSGTRTQRSESNFEIRHSIELAKSGTYPRNQIRNHCMLREVLGSFPQPMLYVKSPFSSSHVSNAVALIQMMRH